MKILLVVLMILMIQWGHKFAHVTTAQLSWHVQNYDLIGSLFVKEEQHEFSQDLHHKLINPLWDRFQMSQMKSHADIPAASQG